jgi:hypothetical protein
MLQRTLPGFPSRTWHRRRPRRAATRMAAITVATVCVALLPQIPSVVAGAASPVTFTVNDTGDAKQTGPASTCSTASGTCTLRAAIADANSLNAPTTIDFDFAGTGPFTIAPATSLPPLADPAGITINGYSQPGSSPNTLDQADNAVIQVQLVGTGETGIAGLHLTQGSNTVTGLSLYNFPKAIWIFGATTSFNQIVGDFLCTNAAGTFRAVQNLSSVMGVFIYQASSHNAIGEPGDANRNVISGCGHYGINISFAGADFNTIQNNIVGLNPSGTADLQNLWHGIHIDYGADSNLVGGFVPGDGNVVSGNFGDGVELAHGTNNRDNQVVGNWIGLDTTGDAAPSWASNHQWGVRLEGAYSCPEPCAPGPGFATVENNVIGNEGLGGMEIDKGQQHDVVSDNTFGLTVNGLPAPDANYSVQLQHGAFANIIGPGNVMTNSKDGVEIQSTGSQPPDPTQTSTVDNTITQNSIYGNTGLGIDLFPYNVANIGGNGSAVVNNDIQAPVITSADPTTITGTTCPDCTVEAYLSDRTITGGSILAFGEGQTYIGYDIADASGNFVVTVTGIAGLSVTVDTTDGQGDTSEFSKNKIASTT